MAPHSGSGGMAPRPKKPSAPAHRMALANPIVACTMIGDSVLGTTWRKRIRPWPTPTASPAVIYSCWITDKTVERTKRAYTGMPTKPMAIMPLSRPGPSMATMAMASRIPGKARMISMTRIMMVETNGPLSRAATAMPVNKPSKPQTTAVKGLTNKADRPPSSSPTPPKSA